MNKKQVYSFDDVLMVPKRSDILSREEVDLTSRIGNLSFNIPVISSPMDTVTGRDMVTTLSNMGGLPIVHRYCNTEDQIRMMGSRRSAAALGVTGDYMQRAEELYKSGCKIYCLDVAHGHHALVEAAIKTLRDKYGTEITIIAGNVATPEGYVDLSEWGADAVRIGIGGGSICSTRIQTGHGVPTFQSVLSCKYCDGAAIIADGGIKTSGDIVKALAAGADFVMLGSMLAGTDESPGSVFESGSGKKYKVYRGMASVEAQVDWRGEARSLEGISTTIPYKGSINDIIPDLMRNVKSGLSYSGARTVSELQSKAEFVVQTSAGQLESSTHILSRNNA